MIFRTGNHNRKCRFQSGSALKTYLFTTYLKTHHNFEKQIFRVLENYYTAESIQRQKHEEAQFQVKGILKEFLKIYYEIFSPNAYFYT